MASREVEADFRAFVTARQDRLLRTAWLLTGDWPAAEDLVQTALARAWPHWGRVMGTAAAEAYVRTVLLNSFRKAWRRRWSGEVPTAALPEHRAAATDVDGRLGLQRALAELPPRQRAVVVLRYFEDLSVAETAAALGVAGGTVKSQTAKALLHLRVSAHLDRSEP